MATLAADALHAPAPLHLHAPIATDAASRRFALVCIVFGIVLLKLALLIVDPEIRLFTGDSGTYLFSAITHGLAPDRSFTYPMLIRLITARSDSLYSLLLLQTAFGTAVATGVLCIAHFALGVRLWLAALAALLVAIEPSQLFYERMIMTEAASTCCLVVLLGIALAYLASGRFFWLLACIAAGVALASLRVGLVPVALAVPTASVLILAVLRGRGAPALRGWRFAAHLLAAIIVTWGCHDAYKRLYGRGTHGAPAYIQDAGVFRLGLVVPLLKREHFAGTGVDPALLDRVKLPLDDPFQREAHIWLPDGLLAALRAEAGPRTREVAGVLADRAIHDDPLGLLRMGLLTFKDYFDAPRRVERMRSDLGFGELPDARTLQMLRERFHYDYAGVARTDTPMSDYFGASSWWLIACLFLLAPLAIVLFALERRAHPAPSLLLALLAPGLVVGQLLCSHIISFRYLHPLPVFFILVLAGIAKRLAPRRDKTPRHALA